MVATIWGDDGTFHQNNVEFDTGIANGLGMLFAFSSKARAVWGQLSRSGWQQHKISTALETASITDLIFFLIYVKGHQSRSDLWVTVGQHLFPQLLFLVGQALDNYASELADQPLEPAPLLKSRSGNCRRIPLVNKYILLQRLKKNRLHRKQIMQSHSDLVPADADLIRNEPLLESGLYLAKLKETFSKCSHVCIAWDPSMYDMDTMVASIYSHQVNIAGCLPIQNMKPVEASELDEEVRALAATGKVTRVHGFAEVRAVSHCLMAVDKPLASYLLPDTLHWKPLGPYETRIEVEKEFFIHNYATDETFKQIPDNLPLHAIPLLTSISDQGGINRPPLDHLCFKVGVPLLVQYDASHRSWNDIRSAMKAVKLFRNFLAASLLFNINYGPAGTKQWLSRKQSQVKDMVALVSEKAHTEPFLSFIPHICAENNINEPTTALEREQLYLQLADMPTVLQAGPLMKLMRWYSWWACEEWFRGQMWQTKLLMLDRCTPEETIEGVELEVEGLKGKKLSEKEELKLLKQKHGTWALAPMLLTPTSFWEKELIAQVGNPCWTLHSAYTSKILTPEDVANFHVQKSTGGWSHELLCLLQNALADAATFKRLFSDPHIGDGLLEQRLEKLVSFVLTLVQKRAKSLVAAHLKPPFRYAGLHSFDARTVAATSKRMQHEWTCILEAERARAQNAALLPLDSMHFRLTSFVRLHYMSNELDLLKGLSGTSGAVALQYTKASICHLGDTVHIENIHLSAKELLKESRHNSASRVTKLSAVFRTKVFESRKVPHLAVSSAEKVVAGRGNKTQVVSLG